MHAPARRTAAATLAVVTAVLVTAVLATVCVLVGPAGARPFEPSGERITGGSDAGSPTALSPGTYVDRLERGSDSTATDGSSRFYAISVARGETPYVAAVVGFPAEAGDSEAIGLAVSLSQPGAESSCWDNSNTSVVNDRGPLVVTLTPPAVGTVEDGCPAGTLIVEVTRSGPAGASTAVPVELTYRREPAVATTSGLPSPAGTSPASLAPDLVGAPATLRSGSSFATAPLVGDGIYADALEGDDFHVVRVHLDWGQRFAYRVSFAGRASGEGSIDVEAEIRTPVLLLADQGPGGLSSLYSLSDRDEMLSGSTFAPVRYENRRSEDDDVAGYRAAGDYYLVIQSKRNQDTSESVRFPYSLQIQVFGEPSGSPSYATPSPGSSTVKAVADGDSGNVPAAIAVGAAAAVLLLGIAVVGLRGRRRRHG